MQKYMHNYVHFRVFCIKKISNNLHVQQKGVDQAKNGASMQWNSIQPFEIKKAFLKILGFTYL